jgi:hypothetical protein
MAKTLKKKPLQRSQRGGDVINSLAQIKTKNAMILAELQWAQENDDCDFSQIKEIAQDEKQIITNEIEEQLAKKEEPKQEPKEEPKEEPQIMNKLDEASGVSSPAIMQQTLTINGFTGTVGELLSRMREKVIQLKKNAGDKYKVAIDKLNTASKKISADAIDTVDKIKEILKNEQLTFKNNRVFGGKTKKIRQPMKKALSKMRTNRKTKRR